MRLKLPVAARQAGVGVGGLKSIYGFTLLAAGRAVALVVMAEAVANGIASAVEGTTAWHQAIVWGLVGAALRAAIAWGTRTFATRSAVATKEALRRDLAARLLDDSAPSLGSAAVLGTHGLDELDNYYRSVLPAITSAAVIPLVIGARLFFADWLSALIIALTITLVPLFMALIGMHTNERVSAASAALSRLSDHMVELARGLPVLVGLGRAEDQTAALRTISDDYRAKTLKTLRVAFMSSLALELISTISVAVVAVSIGLRLVNGDLGLATALVVLVLAPECFTPFRDLGASFHASQEGLGALKRARSVIDAPASRRPAHVDGPWKVSDLTVRFADRVTDAVHRVSFDIPQGEITALQGLSGAGKSTVLDILAGQLRGDDSVTIAGTLAGLDGATVAWLPQHPNFVADTVRHELEIYAEGDHRVSSPRIDSLLRELGLIQLAGESPDQLSPGEARRLALARTFLRVDAGASLVLLDEPTAHLDERSSRVVRRMISALRGRTTVVLVSHDLEVNALASHVVQIGPASGFRRDPSIGDYDPPKPNHRAAPIVDPQPVPRARALPALQLFLRPAVGRYLAAVGLGTLAVLFAVSMTTVSGWLIVKASEHPSIMYLSVAIVGVRFFGIGRSALHYAERLVTHDGVLDSVTSLRLEMWKAFISRGATSRKMLRGASVLDNLVGAADHVRDLAPRALIPAGVGLLTAGSVILAVALLDSAMLPLIGGCLVICLVVAPMVTLAADRRASAGTQRMQSRVLRQFAAMLVAARDLSANGVAPRVRKQLATDDHAAGLGVRRSSVALGAGSAIIVLACCATAVLSLATVGPQVKAGTIPVEIVAVLAFLPLALVDSLLLSAEAVQQWPALAYQLRRINGVIELYGAPASGEDFQIDAPERLDLRGLSARWPGAHLDAISGIDLHITRGQWVVVSGPSGSGKSTLLTVLLGYLAASAGRYSINEFDTRNVSGRSLRKRISWAPQDGYLFDSTLRGNLLIARGHDNPPTDAELLRALGQVGLGELVESLEHGLDTAVGAAGSHLSGGQRQRVAVARTLLASSDVVLLDEPTAHLDEVAAAELMTDLRSALVNKIVVLVTHHGDERGENDLVVDLDRNHEYRDERSTANAA